MSLKLAHHRGNMCVCTSAVSRAGGGGGCECFGCVFGPGSCVEEPLQGGMGGYGGRNGARQLVASDSEIAQVLHEAEGSGNCACRHALAL